MEDNKIIQMRVTLEEVGDVISKFREDIINHFDMKGNHSSRIESRVISISSYFTENFETHTYVDETMKVHTSDDFIIYYLMDDKLVGVVVERRTEFNHAELVMITTSKRQYGTGNSNI